MPASALHPDYKSAATKWSLVRDAVNGLDESNGDLYVAKRSGEEVEGGEKRYKARIARAIYTNYTRRTRAGLLGAVFRKPPTIELPTSLEFMEADADGAGQSLVQLSQYLLAQLFESGRCGVLVDYPERPEDMTREQAAALNMRPSMKVYPAESIINWKTKTVGGSVVLSLVVLAEEQEAAEDEFDHGVEQVYRVLRLNEAGQYEQQLFDADDEPIDQPRIITDANDSPFDHIPFYIVGAENNLPDVDDPVLYDIAVLNVGHYRNSADYENNLAVHSGGTLVIGTGHSAAEWKEHNGRGPVMVGEGNAIVTTEGGYAELLQLNSAQAIAEEMKDKEHRMLQIGARIIAKGTVDRETVESVRIRASSESSVLDTMVTNLDEVVVACLSDAGLFVDGQEPEVMFELNRDYWVDNLDPQLAMALIQLHDVGALPLDSIIEHLKEKDLIDKSMTIEQVKELLLSESPV